MEKFVTKTLLTVLCVSMLTACKREMARKSGVNTVNCRIEQLILKSPGEKDKSGIFTYDAAGNPISYEPLVYGTGSLKYEFRYDNGGRLTDYIAYSPVAFPLTCEFWVRYGYENNRIVRDSVYYHTNYGPALVSFAKHIGFTQYEYDSEERIQRVIYKQYFNGTPNGVVGNYKFDYNEAGNLVMPGAVYDGKASIYRTNKLWMFLSRNYSVNNPRPALSYNSKGLPVAFPAAAARAATLRFFESIDLSDCEIVYDCPR